MPKTSPKPSPISTPGSVIKTAPKPSPISTPTGS